MKVTSRRLTTGLSMCLWLLVCSWSVITLVSSFFSDPGWSRGLSAARIGTGPSSSCPSLALLWGQFSCRWQASSAVSSFPWCTTLRIRRTLTVMCQTTCRQLVPPSAAYRSATFGAAALACTLRRATWWLSPTSTSTADVLPGGC